MTRVAMMRSRRRDHSLHPCLGPIPLLAVQLLWLNLVTNGVQDVALALHLFATWSSGFGAILHVVAPDPALVAAVPLALGLALLFEGYKWLVRRRG